MYKTSHYNKFKKNSFLDKSFSCKNDTPPAETHLRCTAPSILSEINQRFWVAHDLLSGCHDRAWTANCQALTLPPDEEQEEITSM